jgi:predicted transcriptional regulator
MIKLTKREEEVMRHFWQRGAMFVRELVELYPDPKPHFNTLSTMVRSLEAKGYIAHESYGNTYRYYPTISEEQYGHSTIRGAISRYLDNSYLAAVSALVKEEKITLEELRELIDRIERGEQ